MKRKELQDKLETVAPALSNNAMVPSLLDFWFTGTHIMAYNDAIAISTPFKTPFRGTVPSKTLDIIKSISLNDYEFEYDDTNLLIKAGKGEYRLPLLPIPKIQFEMPTIPKVSDIDASHHTALFRGIENCMRSVVTDTSVPEQLGVTVIPNERVLHLYGTNNATLSHSIVTTKEPTKIKRVILSAAFCQQVLRLSEGAGKETKKTFNLYDSHALFSIDRTLLLGRLIENSATNPLNFDQIIKHHLPEDYKQNLWEIPEQLGEMIERACIITSETVDKTYTQIATNNGALEFFSRSDKRGQVEDSLPLPESQPKVDINVDPKLVKNGLSDKFERMLITPDCVIMSRKRHLYLVGTTSSTK